MVVLSRLVSAVTRSTGETTGLGWLQERGTPPGPGVAQRHGRVMLPHRVGGGAIAVWRALLPWPGSWPPGRNAAPVCLVLRAELAGQGRLLVPADERGDGDPDDGGGAPQHRPGQRKCPPRDGGHDRQVHPGSG